MFTQVCRSLLAVGSIDGDMSPAGNLDDDPADEVTVGVQAIIQLDLETGAVTAEHKPPRPLIKGVNFDFAPDGDFEGVSPVPGLPGNQPFAGKAVPISGAVNVQFYPTQ